MQLELRRGEQQCLLMKVLPNVPREREVRFTVQPFPAYETYPFLVEMPDDVAATVLAALRQYTAKVKAKAGGSLDHPYGRLLTQLAEKLAPEPGEA